MADLYSVARMAYHDEPEHTATEYRIDAAALAVARHELLAILNSAKHHETTAVIYARIHKRLMQLQQDSLK